jgi:hypothetical protein
MNTDAPNDALPDPDLPNPDAPDEGATVEGATVEAVTPPKSERALNHTGRPLAGFGPAFGWGLRLTLRWPRLLSIGIPAVVLCGFLGVQYVGAKRRIRPLDEWNDLWILLDEGLLGYIVPLIALLTIASGLRGEISRQTLVYHLVRPISRTTLFLARFASGVVASWILCTLALVVTCAASGLSLPPEVWLSLPVTALVGSLTVGAFYYVVTTLFRGGMITALVYTFVFELLFAGARGAMQKLSIMFHVRGVHHGMVDEAFKEKSTNVADALNPGFDLSKIDGRNIVKAMIELRERLAYDEPHIAMLTCAAITVGLLLFGAYRLGKRDFPLKG